MSDLLVEMAAHLPEDDVAALAEAIRAGPGALERLSARSGSQVLRQACAVLADELRQHSRDYIAGLLVGGAAVARVGRQAQHVDIVWTGPQSEVDTGRLTSRVVVDLIDEAQHAVLIASYATFAEPRTTKALADAIERGVDVTLLYERTADNPDYRSLSDPLPDLSVRRVVWASGQRTPGASLHAKFVVIDATVALVGSANLTGRALDDNLECGVLIRGGPQPKAIEDHVWSLIRSTTLTVISIP